MNLTSLIDVDWLSYQAGVPADFLFGLPVFLTFVMSLVSMAKTREPENYKVGRHMNTKTNHNWGFPLALVILIGAFAPSFVQFLTHS